MSDGNGCKCGAYGSCECGCPDVDWTPQEVYDLRIECKSHKERIEFLEHRLSTLLKASEGMEKALEGIMPYVSDEGIVSKAGRDELEVAEENVGKSLADFRALKETK